MSSSSAMRIFSHTEITYNSEQNAYFKEFLKKNYRKQNKDVIDLPSDLQRYIYDNFTEHTFSVIELDEDNVCELLTYKIPDDVIGVFITGNLDFIPEQILSNKNIVFCDLSFSKIKKLPRSNFFKQLLYFDCSFTELRRIPSNLHNTVVIDCKYTNMDFLPSISSAKNLKYLDLYQTKLSSGAKKRVDIEYSDIIKLNI